MSIDTKDQLNHAVLCSSCSGESAWISMTSMGILGFGRYDKLRSQPRFLLNWSNLNHHLARIRALIQIHQRLWCCLQTSGNDVLPALQLALRQPRRQIIESCRVFLCVVEHDESFHCDSLRLFRLAVFSKRGRPR